MVILRDLQFAWCPWGEITFSIRQSAYYSIFFQVKYFAGSQVAMYVLLIEFILGIIVGKLFYEHREVPSAGRVIQRNVVLSLRKS